MLPEENQYLVQNKTFLLQTTVYILQVCSSAKACLTLVKKGSSFRLPLALES